jgi:organic hydroperoxide reductase OsmC/OhrA
MLKVNVTRMTMHVKASFRVTGSVLNDTVEGEMVGAETRLEVESADSPERVRKVIRNAERGCFVMQALIRPVPVTVHAVLNGERLSPHTEC